MAYRTGTYVAFDGLGETNPTKSDFRFYTTMKGWHGSRHINFKLTDSHEKTYSVRDTSSPETLKARINERLAASKQLVVILSPDTRKTGSMLSYEIKRAVDVYELPLICVYTGYNGIWGLSDTLTSRWPHSLRERINNGSVDAIHIPFKKEAIFDAIGRFYVNGESIGSSKSCYSKDYQIKMGCIEG